MAPFVLDGVRVSSTAVGRLELADFAGAARLLGHPYRMMGRVAPGAGWATRSDFRRDLRLMRRLSPVWGILAVWTHGIESRLQGVAVWAPADRERH